MRKYFFRPFIADPVCASSDPGHHVNVGRYFMDHPEGNVGTLMLTGRAPDNFIGGLTAGERNVIAGNQNGVFITGSDAKNNRIHGNYIGTNAVGAGGNSQPLGTPG